MPFQARASKSYLTNAIDISNSDRKKC